MSIIIHASKIQGGYIGGRKGNLAIPYPKLGDVGKVYERTKS